MKRKALFLDRDGVINEDVGYAYLPEQINFMPGIFEIARRAHHNNELIIIVTNQSGIGRGFYSELQFHDVMEWMLTRFADEGAPITAYYYCPHRPEEGCACRKPKPGMMLKAAEEWNVDLSQSRLIGDKETDIQAGRAAGIPPSNTIIFGHGL